MKKNVFDQCFIKEEKFKPLTLGGNTEITIRQLSIAEVDEQQKIKRDPNKTQDDAIFYAVKCAMVDPVFFTPKELKTLNATGRALIYEVYYELPLIGKSPKEREEYSEKLMELTKKLKDVEKEPSKEDEEKK